MSSFVLNYHQKSNTLSLFFNIKMWQNDKICFLQIFTWHPNKNKNFNCAFEDDKWRIFPYYNFNPFISSLADWLLWITFFLNSCSQLNYLVKSLHIVLWNLKGNGKLLTVLCKLGLFFLIELYDICVQILIFWIVLDRVVGYRLCI